MKHQSAFEVQQLRTKNLVKSLESLSGFVAAVIANMLIPQLLIKYVYDTTTLTVAPPIFEFLPIFTYGLALVYFLVAMIGNFVRERSARRIEKEISLCSCCSEGSCSNDEDDISEEELKELEKIVDKALMPTKKTSSKKVVAKKKNSSKKTK